MQIGTKMLLIITITGDMTFSVSTSMNLNDAEPQNSGYSHFFAIFSCRRVKRDEMDGHRPRQPEDRNCHRLSCVVS